MYIEETIDTSMTKLKHVTNLYQFKHFKQIESMFKKLKLGKLCGGKYLLSKYNCRVCPKEIKKNWFTFIFCALYRQFEIVFLAK